MSGKTITFEELIPGYEFPPVTYELSASLVSKYLRAVDSEDDGVVPPLAITACAIATMMKSFSLSSDILAIHASQELEFIKAVPIGATVECRVGVAQKITRGKMSMLVIRLETFDEGKEKVQSGKATIALTH